MTKVARDSIPIDERVKGLIMQGIEKAGSAQALAREMGYSTPTNIIAQFLYGYGNSAKALPKFRLDRLEKFLEKSV